MHVIVLSRTHVQKNMYVYMYFLYVVLTFDPTGKGSIGSYLTSVLLPSLPAIPLVAQSAHPVLRSCFSIQVDWSACTCSSCQVATTSVTRVWRTWPVSKAVCVSWTSVAVGGSREQACPSSMCSGQGVVCLHETSQDGWVWTSLITCCPHCSGQWNVFSSLMFKLHVPVTPPFLVTYEKNTV